MAFQAALARAPEYVNSWYYTALARYHQQKFDEAVAALRKHFDANPEDLVRSIEAGGATSVAILDGLIGRCAEKGKNLDAAFLVELQVAIDPQNSRYWNNLGLFYRDEGDALDRRGKAEEKTKARGLWEKALIAYERAHSIDPTDPNYMNDLAVVLDYNLNRELERARALYEKAAVRAEEELARKDLTPDMREVRKIALRDAKDNLGKLARKMERMKEKQEAEKREREKKDGGEKDTEKKDGPQ
jgi:tetratricopeptide (TPR) repeat protein